MDARRSRLVIAIVMTSACGEDTGRRDDAGASASFGGLSGLSDGGDTAGDDETGVDDDGDLDGGTLILDLPSADEEGSIDECAEVIEEADVGLEGADIIIVIDNSVSMFNEIESVQENMNAFSQQIIAADVDPHVVMISGFENNSDSGICVPPPLGSGMCPNADHNPPTYWRVGNWVGSHSALARVVQHYPDYAPTIRDGAATHVVVVTDDDSDWTAQQFTNDFVALNPKFADFVLHAIINSSSGTYNDLAVQTGGLVGDLSSNEFQPIFDALADTVVDTASLACEFTIPEPEGGQIFDADQVNVQFDDGLGATLEIGWVAAAAECAGVMNGWYYDDPLAPTTILLCPQTCDAIQGFALARIGIVFGCDTVPAG
jgi:hypothetical protein